MRYAHIIKKNFGGEMPQRVIFFDTETSKKRLNAVETELIFKLGAATYWRISDNTKINYSFYTINDFWNFVFRRLLFRARLVLVAHNLPFDFRVLKGFEILRANGYKARKIIYNGTTNIFEFRKGGRALLFLDNMNYFKSSLERLGQSIGLEKLKMPRKTETDFKKLMVYCKRDVEIMFKAWKLLLEFLTINDLGNFSKTIAGQAFSAYRHRFMPHEIFVHTNKTAINLERAAYHGGRTECFRIGKMPEEDYYLLDVNSMYPSVMARYQYPSKLVMQDNYISVNTLWPLLKKYCIIARVFLNCSKPIFPVIYNEKLVFPTGHFSAVLTTREIEYAIEHNYIVSVNQISLYEKENLFFKYIDFFYNKRLEFKKENNGAFEHICKLFLNSLYGKFGQRNDKYKIIGYDNSLKDGVFEFFDIDKMIDVRQRFIGGKIEESAGKVEGFDSFVAIPAHITADARMQLWRYFEIAGRDNIFYCDTDSIIVNRRGYENCTPHIGENALGFLEVKKQARILKLYGPKDYVFGADEVIKGIRKDATRLSENRFSQVKFEGLAGAIRKGRTSRMIISQTEKELKREYTKGLLRDTVVYPFKLNQLF